MAGRMSEPLEEGTSHKTRRCCTPKEVLLLGDREHASFVLSDLELQARVDDLGAAQ